MDPQVHRRALLAALKTTKHGDVDGRSTKCALLRTTLALGLTGSFVGCAMQHGHPPVFADVAPLADAAVADAAAPIDVGHAVPPDAPVAPVACDAHLASLAITSASDWDWSPAQFTNEAERASAETATCCHQMELDVREAREVVEWPPTPLAMACCDVVVFVNHLEPYSELGCTPWGPPCPPEMPV